jgi:hypothetical protein
MDIQRFLDFFIAANKDNILCKIIKITSQTRSRAERKPTRPPIRILAWAPALTLKALAWHIGS